MAGCDSIRDLECACGSVKEIVTSAQVCLSHSCNIDQISRAQHAAARICAPFVQSASGSSALSAASDTGVMSIPEGTASANPTGQTSLTAPATTGGASSSATGTASGSDASTGTSSGASPSETGGGSDGGGSGGGDSADDSGSGDGDGDGDGGNAAGKPVAGLAVALVAALAAL